MQIDFYEYGKKAYLKDKTAELMTRKARLKNELLNALNEPMCPHTFAQISNDLIKVLQELKELNNEV